MQLRSQNSTYLLQPIHTPQVSTFYNQAIVEEKSKTEKTLFSTGVKMAEIKGIKCKLLIKDFNKVQEMHFREFLRQNHFEVGGLKKKQLIEKYG